MRIDLELDLQNKSDIEERLQPHFATDSTHYRYIIECRRRYDGSRTSFESDKKVQERARRWKQYDSVPSWLEDALNAHHLVYVGETQDIIQRIYDHMWSHGTDGRAALFTSLFPPNYLIDVKICSSRDQARTSEKRIRRILNKQFQSERFVACSDVGEDEPYIMSFSG